MSYPISFRGHVLRVKKRDQLSFAETARRFSVGIASVKRWSKRMDPKPYERKKPRKLDPAALAQDVIDHPDAYQYERAARFGVSPKAIWQALRKLGVTYKKSPASPEGGRRRAAYFPGKD